MQRAGAIFALLAIGILIGAIVVRFAVQAPTSAIDSACRSDRSSDEEARQLRTESEQLKQRIQALTAEQERLAQENDILKRNQQTEELLNQRGRSLPDLPPK